MNGPERDAETEELRRRLEEAEETLRAIREGEVDALVVEGPVGNRIYTLEGADHSYRTLIEAIQQGAVTLSCDGTILYCNRCFASMLKTPHEKVLGASVSDFLPPEHHAAFDELLRTGRCGSSHGELTFQTADGALLPVYLALAPLALTDAVAVCMVVTDLTDQKKHEDLEDVNRRKDEFLAMLAHELRNPLAPIRNAVALLQMFDSKVESHGDLVFACDIIERQVQHMTRLVDDLLDVSRITLGKVKLQKEPVELATVIARAVETSRPIIDTRKHRLDVSLPSQRILLNADPTRLAQIISNLLTNAAKYTDEEGRIQLIADCDSTHAIVRVRDSGIGLPADLLPRVFDLFTQGDRSLARSEGGLGIGLTLVRSLVQMHGGSVDAYSDGIGKGSEFVVRLPLVAGARDCNDPGPTRSPSRDKTVSQRILVVDDNKDGADILAMLLQLMGHQTRVAYTGTEALEAANAYQPHVVLLDIGLPVMDGYEVARRLRQEPTTASTLLVAMTGYGQQEDKHRSELAGFDHHLVKPVAPDVLKTLLDGSAAPESTPSRL